MEIQQRKSGQDCLGNASLDLLWPPQDKACFEKVLCNLKKTKREYSNVFIFQQICSLLFQKIAIFACLFLDDLRFYNSTEVRFILLLMCRDNLSKGWPETGTNGGQGWWTTSIPLLLIICLFICLFCFPFSFFSVLLLLRFKLLVLANRFD